MQLEPIGRRTYRSRSYEYDASCHDVLREFEPEFRYHWELFRRVIIDTVSLTTGSSIKIPNGVSKG